MTVEIRFSVMSPEAGVTVSAGGPPPGMGRPPGMAVPPPVTRPPAPLSAPFAKRLDTLENKTVYLVDTGFGGSYKFMLQLQKWFAGHMASVTTIRKRKPGNVFMDDNDELWEEIKGKGDAVVLGVAG
jgi:hypothetical protein